MRLGRVIRAAISAALVAGATLSVTAAVGQLRLGVSPGFRSGFSLLPGAVALPLTVNRTDVYTNRTDIFINQGTAQ